MYKNISRVVAFGCLFSFAQMINALSLPEYLSAVTQKNKNFMAIEKSLESSQQKWTAQDIQYAPALMVQVAQINDQSPLNSYSASESSIQQYSLGLQKKYKTGTTLGVQLNAIDADNKGITNPLTRAALSQFGFSNFALNLSQSLWKNQWGSSDSLKSQRDLAILKTEKLGLEIQKIQILIESEGLFWDYVFAQEDLKIKKESLDRAQKILSWIKKRVGDGISDAADLYNSEALVALREFQLASSQDEFQALEKKIRQNLELTAQEITPHLVADLNVHRGLRNAQSSNESISRLDVWASQQEIEIKKTVVHEVQESLKSDLTFAASYKTNSFKSNFSDSVSNVTSTDKPTTQLSLTWTYLLDDALKKSTYQSQQADLKSLEIKLQKKQEESQVSWQEMQRRYGEMKVKVELLEKLYSLQTRRANEERKKLSQGRTVTSQVITAEQDVAEAQLNLTKLKAEMRKLESQAQMFKTEKEIL